MDDENVVRIIESLEDKTEVRVVFRGFIEGELTGLIYTNDTGFQLVLQDSSIDILYSCVTSIKFYVAAVPIITITLVEGQRNETKELP